MKGRGQNLICIIGLLFAWCEAHRVRAAEYYLSGPSGSVMPGLPVTITAMVETEIGDNVVGAGYYSFAVDLTISGTAGALGSDVSNVEVNTAMFNNVAAASVGHAEAAAYVGIGGATSDLIPPSFGHNVGDVIALFNFDLLVPASAAIGDSITIAPNEGILENLVVGTFDPVAPQIFVPLHLTVVPEPTTAVLMILGAVLAGKRIRRKSLS